ncbi:hypothetical protein HMPREF0577_0022 [Mobiluncus mulieris ATCC 35243]|nr:hypothetical protein HMPREF0577_0022 [Mobiluncus mulieris ATCC 35243]
MVTGLRCGSHRRPGLFMAPHELPTKTPKFKILFKTPTFD